MSVDESMLDEFGHAAREQLSAPALTSHEQQFAEFLQRNCRSAGYEPFVVAVTGDRYQNGSFLVMAITPRETPENKAGQREALLRMAEENLANLGLLPHGHMRNDLIVRPPDNFDPGKDT